jgi:cytochrome bd-type quinol oxidase subunit 2
MVNFALLLLNDYSTKMSHIPITIIFKRKINGIINYDNTIIISNIFFLLIRNYSNGNMLDVPSKFVQPTPKMMKFIIFKNFFRQSKKKIKKFLTLYLTVAEVICCIIVVMWPKIAAYSNAEIIIMHTPNNFSLVVFDAMFPKPTVDIQLIVK